MGLQDRDYYWEDRNPDGSFQTASSQPESTAKRRRQWYVPVMLAIRKCFPADFGQWHWSLVWIWTFAAVALLVLAVRLLSFFLLP